VGSVMTSETGTAPANGAVVLPSSGKIKFFDPEKGYGFIDVGAEKDVFIHVKELRKSGIVALNDGAQVSFTAVTGPKGLYATDIKITANKAP